MRRKKIYKIPVVEKSFTLDSKYPATENEERIREIEKVSKESYQMGWDEANNKNRNDYELLCKGMNNAIMELKRERDDIWSKCEREIIRLVFAITKKIVYEEVSRSNGKIIENIVNDAISRVKDNKIVSIHLNPDDVRSLETMGDRGLEGTVRAYRLVSDNTITRGGCKVVTDCGGVDSMLETRWNEVVSAFGELDLETEGMECPE